jgi:hypothetical protein
MNVSHRSFLKQGAIGSGWQGPSAIFSICGRPHQFYYARVEREIPCFAAITLVAPTVRFKAFEIFAPPDFAFAIVFICRKSSFVHGRRISFFALAICAPVFLWRNWLLLRGSLFATERGLR